ncbi:hypothetical protein GQF61_01035 [Sphingobacterium sp. DK4209]|uniref:Cardiolipin synthase N-terminal domain-containing protein n=1 Tax=Sphingobacterium zhuxiongii TaxID=2662364 RepID=A0A5Q0Q8E5_9SPHI|nr:hypothetical protein [Sphingobacterium sp. DK4209]QGA25763.1 hypothetical protein GFH32_05255 [Sphingobacterium sp. dk4302]
MLIDQLSYALFIWQLFFITHVLAMVIALIHVATNKQLNFINSIYIALVIVFVPLIGSVFYFTAFAKFLSRTKNS